MKIYKYASVLTIAGSDSSGGAGVQADLKTFAALGCYGTSAITAVTVQNTLGVSAIHPVPPEIIEAQIVAVMDDIKPAAVKIGMLTNLDTVEVVALTLNHYPDIPIIVDPVMFASTGGSLATKAAIEGISTKLFPIATLVTPNIPEATALTGNEIGDVESMRQNLPILLSYGSYAVYITGGHLSGENIINCYGDSEGHQWENFSPFIQTNNTHGTGCTLSAAIAAFMAAGQTLQQSILLAEQYVNTAILQGKKILTGNGAGPLNHSFKPKKLIKLKF